MLAVLDKMEAKPEEGPEMDVDGTPSDGQNGKKCRPIASNSLCLYKTHARIYCAETPWKSYLMPLLTESLNIVNCRICNIPPRKYLCILTLIYNSVVITRYGNVTMLLLFNLCLKLVYIIVAILPYKPYVSVEYITDWYRLGRYRE
jgi:hypothetical protein